MISTFLELKNPLKNATNIFLKLLTKSFVFKKVSKVVVKKQGQVAKLNIFKVEKCTLSFKFATFFYVFLTMLTFWVAFQGGRHFYKEPHYLKSSVIPCYWPWHGGAGRLVQQLYYCWRKPLEAMALCSWSCTYHVISFWKFFWLTLILFWNKNWTLAIWRDFFGADGEHLFCCVLSVSTVFTLNWRASIWKLMERKESILCMTWAADYAFRFPTFFKISCNFLDKMREKHQIFEMEKVNIGMNLP